MFAIVETGGKQYKIKEGDLISVEKIDAQPGDTIELDRVVAVYTDSGELITGQGLSSLKAVAKVVSHRKGPKIRGFKYKAKSNYRRRYGHRQPYTQVLIQSIGGVTDGT